MEKPNNITPIQASVHLLIPAFIKHPIIFRSSLLKSKEWTETNLETEFYLKYVNTIFCCKKEKNGNNPLTSRCLVLENNIRKAKLTVRKHEITLEKTRIFCFNTSIGLLDLCLSVSCERMEDFANICARLRQTDLTYRFNAFDFSSNVYFEPKKMTINNFICQLISPIGKVNLYDHISSNGKTRAELLASVIVDSNCTENLDSLMFRVAEGIDMRNDECISTVTPYCPLKHIRWTITKKGVCSVGILTNNQLNRNFVLSEWRDIVSNRHILWYVMVLHQKYAIYHYLNEIAQKKRPSDMKAFQKIIMAFNTEYRFEMISEDPSYQIPYDKIREEKSIEKVFLDIDEEIERIHTYYDTIQDKNINLVMTIVSLVCVISTFIDIFSLPSLEQPVFELIQTWSFPQLFLFIITIGAMITALSFLVIKPFIRKISGYIKDFICWIWKILFLHKK